MTNTFYATITGITSSGGASGGATITSSNCAQLTVTGNQSGTQHNVTKYYHQGDPDWTAAINRAVSAAQSDGPGSTVYFPENTYYVSTYSTGTGSGASAIAQMSNSTCSSSSPCTVAGIRLSGTQDADGSYGAGYTLASVIIDPPGCVAQKGSCQQATAAAILSNGEITSINVGSGGLGYTSTPNVQIVQQDCNVNGTAGPLSPYFWVTCNSIPVLKTVNNTPVTFMGASATKSSIVETNGCPKNPSQTADNYCSNIFHVTVDGTSILHMQLNTQANNAKSTASIEANNITLQKLNLLAGSETFPVYFAGPSQDSSVCTPQPPYVKCYNTNNKILDTSLSDEMVNNDSLSFSLQQDGVIRNISHKGSRLALYIDNGVSVSDYSYTPAYTSTDCPKGHCQDNQGYWISSPSSGVTVQNFIFNANDSNSQGNGGYIGLGCPNTSSLSNDIKIEGIQIGTGEMLVRDVGENGADGYPTGGLSITNSDLSSGDVTFSPCTSYATLPDDMKDVYISNSWLTTVNLNTNNWSNAGFTLNAGNGSNGGNPDVLYLPTSGGDIFNLTGGTIAPTVNAAGYLCPSGSNPSQLFGTGIAEGSSTSISSPSPNLCE